MILVCKARFRSSRVQLRYGSRQDRNPFPYPGVALSHDSRHDEAGFTLVEMLVASLVFTVAAVSVMSMVLFALTSRYASRIESAALKLSQQKIEELKSHSLEGSALSITGNTLNAEGGIDFTASAAPEATAAAELILNRTRNTKLSFETRWNVTASGSRKIITVATRPAVASPGNLKPTNLKVVLAP